MGSRLLTVSRDQLYRGDQSFQFDVDRFTKCTNSSIRSKQDVRLLRDLAIDWCS